MPVLYRICAVFLRLWVKICGCKIIGRENIPQNQAALVIANHISYGDPVIVAVAYYPQHITFIAKEAFSKMLFVKGFFVKLGVVFLNKEESDLTALRTSVKTLKSGRTVGIFPEGHCNRQPGLAPFMPGAAYIAHKARVPVVPMGIENSGDMLRFWKRNIVIRIGEPIWLDFDIKATHEYLAETSELFSERVASLLPPSEIKAEIEPENKPK